MVMGAVTGAGEFGEGVGAGAGDGDGEGEGDGDGDGEGAGAGAGVPPGFVVVSDPPPPPHAVNTLAASKAPATGLISTEKIFMVIPLSEMPLHSGLILGSPMCLHAN